MNHIIYEHITHEHIIYEHHMFTIRQDSIIKSSKPLRITLRDTAILTIITVIITIIYSYFHFWFTEVPPEKQNWSAILASTVISSASAAIIYEYSGVNNMLAENSIRYARGSTLDKYKSRREAMLYKYYYKLLNSGKYNAEELKDRFNALKFIIKYPNIAGKIADGKDIEKICTDNKCDAGVLSNIPPETIKSLNYIGDRLSKNIIYDILVNGWSGYKYSGIITSLDHKTIDRANIRGAEIAELIS